MSRTQASSAHIVLLTLHDCTAVLRLQSTHCHKCCLYSYICSSECCQQQHVGLSAESQTHLEKLAQGLNEGELQVLRQAAHVVVRLDHVAVLLVLARRRHRLYDIWIQRSLLQARQRERAAFAGIHDH